MMVNIMCSLACKPSIGIRLICTLIRSVDAHVNVRDIDQGMV